MRTRIYLTLLIAALSFQSQLFGQSMKEIFRSAQIYDAVKKAEKRKDYAELATLYAEWMKIYPEDPSIISGAANALFNNGQYKEAIPPYQKLLDFGGYARELSIWTNLIDCYSKTEQPAKAIVFITQQLDKYPKNEIAFSALAYAHIANKTYEDAIVATKRSIELSAENPVAYFFQGMAYGSVKKYRDAIPALQKSIALYPQLAEAYLFLGRYLMDDSETEEAITTLKKGIADNPASPLLHIMLGIAYFKLGKYTISYEEINKAIQMDSKPGIGVSIQVVDKYPVIKQIQDNTPASKAELKPGDIITQVNGKSTKKMSEDDFSSLLTSNKGNPLLLLIERNENTFTKVITCTDVPNPEAAISYAMRSILSRYTNNKIQQQQDIIIAEALKSQDETTKEYISMARGLLAMDEGNYESTIQFMAKVPDNSFARMYEAIAFAEKSLFNASLAHYQQIPVEDLIPENIPLMQDNKVLMKLYQPQAIQHKEKAEEFLTKDMPQEALFELSEALMKSDETERQAILDKLFSIVAANPLLAEIPETARKFALRAEIMLKEGNLEEAITENKKAISAAPYIASLYYNMALIKSQLEKYADAIKYMQIYVKAQPNAPNIRQAKDEIIKWEFQLERKKEKK